MREQNEQQSGWLSASVAAIGSALALAAGTLAAFLASGRKNLAQYAFPGGTERAFHYSYRDIKLSVDNFARAHPGGTAFVAGAIVAASVGMGIWRYYGAEDKASIIDAYRSKNPGDARRLEFGEWSARANAAKDAPAKIRA